jgi:drug/metabolite transporter (DMT)-like permease
MLTSSVEETIPQDTPTWLLLAGLAIGSALIPQLIYTVCSPVIGASRTAVFGSIELPTMIVVSIVAFGEPLTTPQAVACLIIVSAIVLTQSRATRNVSTNLSKP